MREAGAFDDTIRSYPDSYKNQITVNREQKTILSGYLRDKATLRSIYMAAPVGVALEESGKILSVNWHVCRISGYSEEELVGCNPDQFFESKEEYARIVSVLDKNINTNDLAGIESRIIKKDGTPIDVFITASSIGKTGQSVVCILDISARKKAEKALAESENNFRGMFEVMPEGIALYSTGINRFVAANPALCRLLEYSEQEICLLSIDEVIAEDVQESMRKALETAINKDVIHDMEGVVLTKTNKRIEAIISGRGMLWNGMPVIQIVFRDITRLKEIQERLRKKNLEVLEFTNMVTHDLRKPLTALKIILELADKEAFGHLEAEGRDLICTGLEAASYMQGMLEDLMESAKLETGKIALSIEATSLIEAIEKVINRLRCQIEDNDIIISIPKNDSTIMVDKKQFERLLTNLISNAITYSGNTLVKRIRIGCEKRNGETVVFVADNGIGIPVTSQEHLFEKFRRGTNVAGIQGTGLGLSIVKGIVEAHGGRVWFESAEGTGTTFFFTLGVKKNSAADEIVEEHAAGFTQKNRPATNGRGG